MKTLLLSSLWLSVCTLSDVVTSFSQESKCMTPNLQIGKSFVPRRNQSFRQPLPNKSLSSLSSSSSSSEKESDITDDWISLLPGQNEDFSVKKKILLAGAADGSIPFDGDQVEINYVGTLVGVGGGQSDWTVEEVVQCWLSTQQGLDGLGPAFMEAKIDGQKLLDEAFFTEDLITNTLGVSNRIQCKKLAMAARRLMKQQNDYVDGMEFDSNADRGSFSIMVGKGKVIKAMELAVSTMRVGEKAQIISRCDYAYGSDGLRKKDGDIIVPPFATLCFDITMLSIQASS